jgi:4-hydroxy 2-oxovalerate aldolase
MNLNTSQNKTTGQDFLSGNICILDCTLRDGGYINNFQFGKNAIRKIIHQLTEANIDIVECGFLEDGTYDDNTSVFNRVEAIRPFIPKNRKNTMYVAMACYGEYSLSNLADYDGSSIDGIRVTFHYNEIEGALEYCKQIQKKGYKLFVQPVGTPSYSDEQLIALIHSVNEIHPFAFYLVDTLGLMDQDDVLRMFYLINHNLEIAINLGFHSHNNLQLSFSNCQLFVRLETTRKILLDSSIYGMGRGAGNLNTELIANYINKHKERKYVIESLLEVIDEFILHIREKFEWGYSVPYFLAAVNGCHPNYASYLSDKQTLPVKSISAILRMIQPDKRALFSKELAEQKYREFQKHEIDDSQTIQGLQQIISGKNILLIAPGHSLGEHRGKIKDLIVTEKCLVLSVSFVPDFISPDFVFLSNYKRFETTFNRPVDDINLIHTSNIQIPDEKNASIVNYASLLNEEDIIMDNSALMVLNLLIKLSPRSVYLAGLDGYQTNKENYYATGLDLIQNDKTLFSLNKAMQNKIKELKTRLNIKFITPSLYSENNEDFL